MLTDKELKNRKFRYIDRRRKGCLSDHERDELAEDFDIDIDGFYVLVPLTKAEWSRLDVVR